MRTLLVSAFVLLTILGSTSAPSAQPNSHLVTGVVQGIQGNTMTVRTDNNIVVTVDLSNARRMTSNPITVGERVAVMGAFTGQNQLTARAIDDFSEGGRPVPGGGTGGVAPQGDFLLTGVVQSVQGNRIAVRTDNNVVVNVDASNARRMTSDSITVGERVAVVGAFTDRNQMTARAIDDAGSAQAAGGAKARGQGGRWEGANRETWQAGGRGNWERATGTVVALEGSNEVRLRTDAGKEIVVNMSQAQKGAARALQVGDRVSVVGEVTAPNYLEARGVRERRKGDSADQGRDGWQIIPGQVQAVQGNTLTLRTDDGRTLAVDVSSVSQESRSALSQGQRVTVVGHDWTGPNRLRAEHVKPDSADPSAAPRGQR